MPIISKTAQLEDLEGALTFRVAQPSEWSRRLLDMEAPALSITPLMGWMIDNLWEVLAETCSPEEALLELDGLRNTAAMYCASFAFPLDVVHELKEKKAFEIYKEKVNLFYMDPCPMDAVRQYLQTFSDQIYFVYGKLFGDQFDILLELQSVWEPRVFFTAIKAYGLSPEVSLLRAPWLNTLEPLLPPHIWAGLKAV